MAKKTAPRYVDWRYLFKPVQLIKTVWGLGKKKHCIDLTVIHDDSLLMDMDAPMAIPAGSLCREETPDGDTIFFAARMTHVMRPDY